MEVEKILEQVKEGKFVFIGQGLLGFQFLGYGGFPEGQKTWYIREIYPEVNVESPWFYNDTPIDNPEDYISWETMAKPQFETWESIKTKVRNIQIRKGITPREG